MKILLLKRETKKDNTNTKKKEKLKKARKKLIEGD
jgi:hypothetical protein